METTALGAIVAVILVAFCIITISILLAFCAIVIAGSTPLD